MSVFFQNSLSNWQNSVSLFLRFVVLFQFCYFFFVSLVEYFYEFLVTMLREIILKNFRFSGFEILLLALFPTIHYMI